MNVQEELKALKERIAELEGQVKEEYVKGEQAFPQGGDDYWFVDAEGNVLCTIYTEYHDDKRKMEIGNIFKTKEQAEFAAEKLKVEAELRKFSRPFESVKFNHYIFFYIDGNSVEVGCKTGCHSQGIIYFESEEKAQQAIDAVGVERIKKYIFEVED